MLLAVLGSQADVGSVAVVRALLGCLAVLLRAQPGPAWELPELQRSLAALLAHSTHPKPKIRRAGQHAVVGLVRGGDPALLPHPAAAPAAHHCLATIAGAGPGEVAVLHSLGLLRELLPALPRSATREAAQTVLRLLTLGSPVLVTTALGALHGLFAGRPPPSRLPGELAGQLVSALYEHQPGPGDTAPCVAWLAALQEGLLLIHQGTPVLAESHLPRFCRVAAGCWLAGRQGTVRAAGLAVRAVLAELGPGLGEAAAGAVLTCLEECLSYQHSAAWRAVLPALGTAVEVSSVLCPDSNAGLASPGRGPRVDRGVPPASGCAEKLRAV